MTGVVAWFTGLPSAGKSTLAAQVAGELRLRGITAVTLDSDDLRNALVPPLGYDEDSRAALYTMLARLAAGIARQGHVVLVPATAHRRAFRDAARALAPQFLEIFVDTPVEECARRDTKGLYAAQTAQAPGVGVTYEPPLAPEVRVTPQDAQVAAAIALRIDDLVP
jgi:adenylylsulfate kinase